MIQNGWKKCRYLLTHNKTTFCLNVSNFEKLSFSTFSTSNVQKHQQQISEEDHVIIS